MLQVQKPRCIWPLRLLSWLFGATPRWLHFTLAALSVAAAVLTFWHRGLIKTEVKAWMSRRLVKEGRELIQQEITQREGVQLLLDAWHLSPEEPEVTRALARASSEIGLPHYARFFYTQLPRLQPLTPEDELDLASALARLSDHTGARLVLDQFQHAHGETPELWRAHASLATQAGDAEAARAAMQKVIQITPEDSVARIHHAASLATSEDTRQQEAGIDALLDQFQKSLATRDIEGRNHCFWTLAALPLTDPARRDRFSRLIVRMPWQNREREVTLQFLGYPMPLSDASRQKLRTWMREFLTREASSLTAADRLAICRILQRHKEHLLSLEVIPHEMALQEAQLCAARLDSLMAEGLVTPAANLVNSPLVPIQRHIQALFQAWISLEGEGDSSKSIKMLGEALEVAREQDRQGSFIAIGHLAARYQQWRVACEAFAAALHPQYPVATHLLPPFLDAARRGGLPTAETLRHLVARENSEAWNTDLHRQTDYLRLLHGDSVERILVESKEQLQASPTKLYAAFLAAFATYRLGEAAGAVEFLSQLKQPHPWQPHERAAMTAILRAAGESALADQMAASIPAQAPLFPEEKRLLTRP